MIQAIKTWYKGTYFKSRLEAKWAVYFDELGLKWIYEHEGFETPRGWYLPDFYFPDLQIFAEVKPSSFTKEQLEKCFHLSSACVLLSGVPAWKNYPITREADEWCDLRMSAYKKRLWVEFDEKPVTDEPFPSPVEFANNYQFKVKPC